MIVGHAALAFALVAVTAALAGVRDRRAVQLGLAAGAFALVPDVDMVYAALGLARSGATGVWSATDAFWGSSKAAHRLSTHSLLVGIPAAMAFALATRGRLGLLVGAASLVTLAAAVGFAGGFLAGAMLVVFGAAGIGVALAAGRRGLETRVILGTALVGLLTHPFGDVFTGTAPTLLYPLDVRLLPDRIALHPDPTLNLLAVFGLELATLWLAAATASSLHGVRLGEHLHPRGAVGVGYAIAALILPPPTLDVSYHFVFSVLAVGTVGVTPLSRPLDRRDAATAAVTGLVAVSLAALGYALIYRIA